MFRVIITLLAAVLVLGQSVPEAAAPEKAAVLEAISKAFEGHFEEVPVAEANEAKTLEVEAEPLEVEAEPLEVENQNVEAIINANTTVDGLLSTFVNTKITSDHMPITQNIAISSLKLDDCFLDKLMTSGGIHRNGDATLNNVTNILSTKLNVNKVEMECHWEMLIYDGFITVETDGIDFELEADMTTIKLTDFKVTKINDVAVTFSGMVTLDETIRKAIEAGINANKGAIEKALADLVMKLLG